MQLQLSSADNQIVPGSDDIMFQGDGTMGSICQHH
jgi:hypothetical protein